MSFFFCNFAPQNQNADADSVKKRSSLADVKQQEYIRERSRCQFGIMKKEKTNRMDELATIQRKIYEIRGQKVILDRDLAALYQVETRVLNQAVKRNIERFPEDFMFHLTWEEAEILRSQSVMSSADFPRSQFVTLKGKGKNIKYLPYAFTEHGVIMLASLLRSNIAITMSVQITRAFVAMRQAISALAATESKIELLNERVEKLNMYIEEVLRDQNEINETQDEINRETSMQLELINESLAELRAKPKPKDKPRRKIKGLDT